LTGLPTDATTIRWLSLRVIVSSRSQDLPLAELRFLDHERQRLLSAPPLSPGWPQLLGRAQPRSGLYRSAPRDFLLSHFLCEWTSSPLAGYRETDFRFAARRSICPLHSGSFRKFCFPATLRRSTGDPSRQCAARDFERNVDRGECLSEYFVLDETDESFQDSHRFDQRAK
jgi:hypothetical protein